VTQSQDVRQGGRTLSILPEYLRDKAAEKDAHLAFHNRLLAASLYAILLA
jgi:hypothetical protein